MKPMNVDRLESMSPNGFLRLHIQEDGDVIITVGESDQSGGFDGIASVEFCTPFGGGGGSPKTHKALVELAKAMAEDNADPVYHGRAGEFNGVEILANFVERKM
jgi:hypothetical protein